MNERRDPDVTIAAWLDEGPTSLPPVTRQVIVSSIHLTPQRRRSVFRLPWGDHTMFATPSRLAAAAAIAVLLAGSGMAFFLTSTSPPGENAPGAAATASPGRPVTYISGTTSCTDAVGGTTTVSNRLSVTRGAAFECTNEVNDPRVNGTWTSTWNTAGVPGGRPNIWWGTAHREDADGAWDCSWNLTDNPRVNVYPVLGVCRGSGEYDGLTYVFEHVMGGAGADANDLILGYIYEGPPPGEWVPAAP